MAKKEIRYGIGFDINKSGLEDLKKELKLIQSFTAADLKIFDPSLANKSIDEVNNRLKTVHNTANDIQYALEKSFNPKLDTISLQNFQKYLAETGTSTIPKAAEGLKNVGDVGKQTFSNLTNILMTTKQQLKETTSWADKLGESLTNTIRWKIASGIIDTFTGSIQSAWGYAKRLDASLNDIRIVTNKSADDMERFSKQANKAAKGLGAATTNYTNAALIYYQQGLSEEDVAARTNVTVKAANVTGQSSAEVSEQLTAVWNGYKVVAEEAELYVDKLAAVAASTAADLEELSTGMSKVASAAYTMGVDIDQLSAQLSTIVSVTRQDAAVVGTALKTIYARMGDLKVSGVDEFGTSLGDVSGQLKQMGIDVLDQEGNLRDMGMVIEEVASKWGTWTDAQQQAAAVAIAGKRQYNNLIALFENWDMYESALTTSQTSAGTLQKQQDIYMDSIEAHLKQLTVASEKLWDALINNDAMNSFIDLLTGAVELAGNFTDSIGGLIPLLMSLAPLITKSLGKNVGDFVSSQVNNFKSAQYNKKELAAKAAVNQGLLGQEKDVENADPLVREWLTLQEKRLKYASVMSIEEQNQADERLKDLGEEIALLKEKKRLLESMIGDSEKDPTSVIQTSNKSEIDQLTRQKNRASTLKNDSLDNLNRLEIQRENLVAWASGPSKNDYHGANGVGISGLNKNSSVAEMQLAAQKKYEELSQQIEEKTREINQLIQKEDELDQKLTLLQSSSNKKIDENMSASDRIAVAKEDSKNLKSTSSKMKEVNTNLNINKKDAYKEWKQLTATLKEYNTVSNETIIKIDRIERELKELEEGSELSETELRKLQARISDVANDCDNTAEELDGFVQDLEETTQEIEQLDKTVENSSKTFEEDYDKAIEKTTQQITQIIGYISSLIAAIKMLHETGSIWQNEDLNTGEKIAQTIPIILSLLLMSIPIVKLVGGLIIKTNEEIGKSAAKSLGIYGLILAAIALVVTAVIAVVGLIASSVKEEETALEKATKAFEEAQKRAEEAKKKVKELRSEYNQLIDDMNALHDAKTMIDELRVGTVEWQEAVFDLNNQVMDLITKYPLLAQYMAIDDNGVYGIQQEGWDILAKQQRESINNQNRFALSSTVDTYYKKENLIKEQGTEDRNNILSDFATENNYEKVDKRLYLGYGTLNNDKNFHLSENNNSDFLNFLRNQGKQFLTEEVINTFKSGFQQIDFSIDLNELEKFLGNDEQAKTFLENLNNTQLDQEYKDIFIDLVENIQNTNKQLEENKRAINASTKAYTIARANEKGYNEEVYTDLTADKVAEVLSKGLGSYNKTFFGYTDGKRTNKIYDVYTGDKIHDTWDTLDNAGDYNAVQKRVRQIAEETFGTKDLIIGGLTSEYLKDMNTDELEKNLTFTINGKEYTIQELLNLWAEKEQKEEIDKTTEKYDAYFNTLDKKGYSHYAAYFMDDEFNKDELLNQWEGANLAALEEIDYQDAALGTDYGTNLGDFKGAFEGELKTILKDTNYKFDNPLLKLFSLEDAKNFANNLSFAGRFGIDLEALFGSITDPETFKKVNDLFTNTDWSSVESVNNFKSQLIDLGLDISKLGANWTGFIDKVTSGTNQWILASDRVIENLRTINSIAKDLSTGDIISLEDFKELKKIAPEIEEFFIKTADGMKLIASPQELTNALKQQYGTLKDIETKYQAIRVAAKNVTGDKNFDISTFKTSGATNITDYFDDSNKTNLLKAVLGDAYNENLIASYKATLTDPNADTSSQEYIKALNGLSNYAQIINQTALDAANGVFSSDAAREIYATEVAGNWSEAKSALVGSKDASDDTNKKILANWSNTLFAELGIESSEFFDLSEANVDKLQTAVKNMRKTEINLVNDLERDIDKAFGQDKIDKINALSTEYSGIASTVKNTLDNILLPQLDDEAFGSLSSKSSKADIQNYLLGLDPTDENNKTKINLLEQILEYYDIWQENLDASVDAAIEKFNTTIEIRLDLESATKDWVDFKANYLERGVNIFSDLSPLEKYENALKNIYTVDLDAAEEAFKDLNKFYGWALINEDKKEYQYQLKSIEQAGFKDEASFYEALGKALDTARNAYEDLFKTAQQMSEAYLETQQEIVAIYDKQFNRLSNINKLREGSASLGRLIGENVVDQYEKIATNENNAFLIAKQQAEVLKAEYKKAFDQKGNQLISDEQLQVLEEQMTNAANTVIEKSQSAISAIINQMLEEFKQGVDDIFTQALGEGNTYSYLSTAWDMALLEDERYLDAVNKEYEISQIRRQYQGSIDATDNLNAQNKLNKAMQQQLNMLEEKDKLSQKDIDRANAMYDLTLKQIALEEAQQTANKMKLTRDAMGNYTYQYVTDEDAIAKAEGELAAAENAFYNVNKEAAKESISDIFSLIEEGYTKIGELRSQGLDDEAEVVYETYFGENGLVARLTEDFDAIENGLDQVGLSFEGSSVKETFDKLAGIDFAKFGETIETAYDTATTSLEPYLGENGHLAKLLNNGSPLVTAIGNLTNAFGKDVTINPNSTVNIPAITDLTGETQNMINLINGLRTKLDTMAESLTYKADKALENQYTEANTNALKDNTSAISYLSQLLDDDTKNDKTALDSLLALLEN